MLSKTHAHQTNGPVGPQQHKNTRIVLELVQSLQHWRDMQLASVRALEKSMDASYASSAKKSKQISDAHSVNPVCERLLCAIEEVFLSGVTPWASGRGGTSGCSAATEGTGSSSGPSGSVHSAGDIEGGCGLAASVRCQRAVLCHRAPPISGLDFVAPWLPGGLAVSGDFGADGVLISGCGSWGTSGVCWLSESPAAGGSTGVGRGGGQPSSKRWDG